MDIPRGNHNVMGWRIAIQAQQKEGTLRAIGDFKVPLSFTVLYKINGPIPKVSSFLDSAPLDHRLILTEFRKE